MSVLHPFNITRYGNTQQAIRERIVIKIPSPLCSRANSQIPTALCRQIVRRCYIPAFSTMASTVDFKLYKIVTFFFLSTVSNLDGFKENVGFSMFLFFLQHFASLQCSKLEPVFVFKISWFSWSFIELNKRTVLISWIPYCYIMSSALCRFFPDRYENKVLGLECSRQVTVKEPQKNRLRSCSFIRWCSIIFSLSARFLLVAILNLASFANWNGLVYTRT